MSYDGGGNVESLIDFFFFVGRGSSDATRSKAGLCRRGGGCRWRRRGCGARRGAEGS